MNGIDMAGYRQPRARSVRRVAEVGAHAAAHELLDRAADAAEEAAAVLRGSGREELGAMVARPVLKAVAVGREHLQREGRARRRARQSVAEAHDDALQDAIRLAARGGGGR